MTRRIDIPQAVRIAVYSADLSSDPHSDPLYAADGTQGSLSAFIRQLNTYRSLIPEEYRTHAYCRISHDLDAASCEIGYQRPETTEEVAARVAIWNSRLQNRALDAEKSEFALYERLRAKFEDKS